MNSPGPNTFWKTVIIFLCAIPATLIIVTLEWFLVGVLAHKPFPFQLVWRTHYLIVVGMYILIVVVLEILLAAKAFSSSRRWRCRYREVMGYYKFLDRATAQGYKSTGTREGLARFFRLIGDEASFRKYLAYANLKKQ